MKEINLEILQFSMILMMIIMDGIVSNTTCKINLDKKPKKNAPMILDTHGDMIYPTKSRILVFSKVSFKSYLWMA